MKEAYTDRILGTFKRRLPTIKSKLSRLLPNTFPQRDNLPKKYGKIGTSFLPTENTHGGDNFTYSKTNGSVTGTTAETLFYFIRLPDSYIVTSIKANGNNSANSVILRRQPYNTYSGDGTIIKTTSVNTRKKVSAVIDNERFRYFITINKGANDIIYSAEIEFKIGELASPFNEASKNVGISKKIFVFGNIQLGAAASNVDIAMHATRGVLEINETLSGTDCFIPLYLPHNSRILNIVVYGNCTNGWELITSNGPTTILNGPFGTKQYATASAIFNIDNENYYYWCQIRNLINGDWILGAEIELTDPELERRNQNGNQ
ncbi:MAG: hypothetical protein U9N86_10395 [Bacteroidota bacterium]|nr:hypothetical protein [Bacteroidota bacterium]